MKTAFANSLIAWVRWVEAHARQVLIFLLILCLASAFVSVNYSRINSDLSTLIKPSAEVSWYQENEEFKQAFPQFQQTAVLVLSGEDFVAVEQQARLIYADLKRNPSFDLVFAPTLSMWIAEKKLYLLPDDSLDAWIQGVQYNYGALMRLAEDVSYANVALILADQLSTGLPLALPVSSVMDSLSLENKRLRLYSRLHDASQASHYQLIFIKAKQAMDRQLPNAQIIEEIRRVSVPYLSRDGVKVRLTGELMLAHEEISAGLRGVGLAGIVSLLLLGLILAYGLRSLRLIIYIFSLLAMGLVLTAGLSVFTVGSYNALSLIFVVMFFGLGVDFAVHFTLRVREAFSEQKATDKLSASESAAKDMGGALALCMLTSALAFLSFYPTDYRGLAELGIISAGGMLIAFCLSLTLLPALIKLFGLPSGRPVLLPSLRIDAPLRVCFVSFLVCLLALTSARELDFDYSVLAMRDAETEAMSTLLELQRADLVTDYSIFVLAKDAAEAKRLKRDLVDLPEVSKVAIPSDLVPSNQGRVRERLQALLSLHADLELEWQASEPVVLNFALDYLDEAISHSTHPDGGRAKIYSARLRAEPPGGLSEQQLSVEFWAQLRQLKLLLSASPFDIDDLPDDLRQSLISAKGQHLVVVHPVGNLDSREATTRFIDAVRSRVPNIAGRTAVEWGVGQLVVEAFIKAFSLSIVLVMLLLVSYFRGLILPLLVLTPILMALVLSAAITQWFGIGLNMANILVVPLIIGLGVDTGIHVVARYKHQLDKAGDAVRATLTSSTSTAVVISGLTTIGTFFSLSFSPHKGAASIGMVLTIAIACLLLTTFVVLPALLQIYQKRWRTFQP